MMNKLERAEPLKMYEKDDAPSLSTAAASLHVLR